jgi:predicted secreted hydrolase
LTNNTDIMIFSIRNNAGPDKFYKYGSLLRDGGAVHTLNGDSIRILPLDTWRSGITGITYPAGWRLELPGHLLTVTPKMPNQELNASFRYWEGAVRISGVADDRPVHGQGYVELTGYR